MNLMKRMLSFLLALVLLMGNIPAVAFATEDVAVEEAVIETTPETEPAVPTEIATEPAEETVAPTEAVTEPAEETAAPTEAATEPAEEITAPTQPAVPEETIAPTELPTEEPTHPAEENTTVNDMESGTVTSDFFADAVTLDLKDTALRRSLDQQIRAFADSIDKPNANDDAAEELATHGMFKNGKKLSAGKNHVLTATLWNSELMQTALADGCEAAIRSMQQLGLDQLENVLGGFSWYEENGSSYYIRVYTSQDPETRLTDWTLVTKDHTGKRNSYDNSLDWMAGCTSVRMTFKRTKVTADMATYQVSVTVSDRFDFSIRNSDGFDKLISGIGALLFCEFDWESKVTFNVTVPYDCSHSSGNYHWTYDPDTMAMTSDGSADWQTNTATCHTFVPKSGKESYYYELEDPIQLFHDKPWVMEFDVKAPGSFQLFPTDRTSSTHPSLTIGQKKFLAVYDHDRVKFSEKETEKLGLASSSQTIRNYYGVDLTDYFSYSNKKIYSFRLENEVKANGSNMIYLSVWEVEKGKVLVDHVPMDNYYQYESWIKKYVLMEETNNWVGGKDLSLSYLGNLEYPFSAAYFDLRVWENGKDGETASYYKKTNVTAPTCDKRGYTTYTCRVCGYGRKTDYVAATGHSYQVKVTPPTCTQEGFTSHTCSVCGDTYKDTPVATPGHSYETVVTPPTCTDDGYTTHTCSVCSHTYQDAAVTAPGHDMGGWVVTSAPGCLESGFQHKECSRCGYAETEEIPATGHSYETVVTPPTCTEDGYTAHTCHCGDSYTDTPVAAFGHTEVTDEAVTPTCTETGLTEGKHCGRCDEVLIAQTVVDALGHSWNAGDGICATCGAICEHNWMDPTGVKPKTCSICAMTTGAPLGLPKPAVKASKNAATGGGILTWEHDGEADYYKIYRATGKNGKFKSYKTVTEPMAEVGVGVGKTYYYKVKAICEADSDLNSSYSSVVKVTGRCKQPEITVEAKTSTGKPFVDWAKVSGAKKYYVYRATSLDGTYKKVKTTTSTSYTDKSAKVGVEYFYKVKAVGSKSTYNGAYSEIKSCLTVCARPEVELSTNKTTGKPIVEWEKISGAVSYEIYRSENGGEYELISTQTELTYTDENTVVDGAYSYKVKAIANDPVLNSAESAAETITAVCAKPKASIALDGKKPMVSWDSVEGATKYYVYRSTKKSSGYKKVATVEEGESYRDSKAKKGTTYYYKIVAVSENTKSAYSNVVKIKSK